MRECIFQVIPRSCDLARLNVLLSYQIQGAYYAYMENHMQFGAECVLETISEAAEKLSLDIDLPAQSNFCTL